MKRKPFYISGEKIFQVVDVVLMSMLALIIIIPFFTVVMTSFVSEAEIARRGSFIMIPESFDFSAYWVLWNGRKAIIHAYGNTLFRVFVGTALQMAMTICFAYGLSRKGLKGRGIITTYVFITMLFGGGLIPNFMLVKSLGLLDSRWSMIFPGLISTWNMLVMRNFFMAIPDSLKEAAIIDGANDIQVLTRVVLPLSKASIATIGLFYAVGHWNAWFDAMIYINDKNKLPMQNLLRNIITATMGLDDMGSGLMNNLASKPPTQAMRSAVIIVTVLPILLVYPFIQKYFVKGVMVGSVKG